EAPAGIRQRFELNGLPVVELLRTIAPAIERGAAHAAVSGDVNAQRVLHRNRGSGIRGASGSATVRSGGRTGLTTGAAVRRSRRARTATSRIRRATREDDHCWRNEDQVRLAHALLRHVPPPV